MVDTKIEIPWYMCFTDNSELSFIKFSSTTKIRIIATEKKLEVNPQPKFAAINFCTHWHGALLIYRIILHNTVDSTITCQISKCILLVPCQNEYFQYKVTSSMVVSLWYRNFTYFERWRREISIIYFKRNSWQSSLSTAIFWIFFIYWYYYFVTSCTFSISISIDINHI